MLTRILNALAILGLTAAFAWPQDAMVVQTTEPPFVGKVTASHLNVRICPKVAPDSTIVTVVKKGTKVKVVEEKQGWYGIVPPTKAWVWVWGRHFKVSSEGATSTKTCTMRSDSRVTASKLGTMRPGETVKILKQHLGWFKVTAPPSLRLWVSAKFIQFDKALESPRKAGATPDKSALDKIEEARKLHAEMRTDGREIDYGKLISLYSEAQKLAESDEIRDIARRMTVIYEQRRDLEETFERSKKLLKEGMKNIKGKFEKAEKAEPEVVEFAFTGKVQATGKLLRNRPGTHMLMDEKGEIVCFLKSREGDQGMVWALNGFYEKEVGVRGTIIHDPKGWTGYDVVIIDEIEPILSPEEEEGDFSEEADY